MDWLADMGGFPYTLSRCPIGGRHGADDAVRGTVRLHHRAGVWSCLHAAPGGDTVLSLIANGDAVAGVGCFSSRQWLVSLTP